MIYLGSDHRGFELKEKVKDWLKEWRYQYEDMGPFEYNKDDDYPDFVSKAAGKVAADPDNSKAIILGSSGQGEAMVANKFKGVRAAVFYGPPFQIRKSRVKWLMWFFYEFDAGRILKTDWGKILNELVKLSREHNNANVLSLGASFLDARVAKRIIKLWLDTPFSNEERHQRRINKF